MLSLAEELAAVDDDCEPVGRPALYTHRGARPSVSAGCDKLGGVKRPTASRTSRREPCSVERISFRLRFALERVAAGACGRRVKRVNDLGHMVDEVPSEVELDLVVAVSCVRGVVERKWFERVAESASAQRLDGSNRHQVSLGIVVE